MTDKKDPLIAGLIKRSKDYLLTKKGEPRKHLGRGQVMISAKQLKWLVDHSPIREDVYEG